MTVSNRLHAYRCAIACMLVVVSLLGLPVTAQVDGPRVAVDALQRDFGRVQRGKVVSETFTLRNTGNAPLVIESMQFSTPGMRARVTANIGPGESAALEIEWDTRQYTRDAVGQALLMLNDPETPQLVLTLSGYVVSPIEIEPVPAFYLSQFAGERATQTVTIHVNQERDVRITDVERQGKGFAIDVDPIEPGRVYEVTATVASGLAPARYQGAVLLHTDDPERPRIRLEVNILVKQAVHASVEVIDIGRVRIAALKANPSVLELLRQTVLLESQAPQMRITRLESDLPFVTLSHTPHEPAQRVRVDVGLDPNKLVPGRHSGVVRIRADVAGGTEIVLPVELTVVD